MCQVIKSPGFTGIICGGNEPTHEIYAGGRWYFFEWHHYSGPAVLHRRTWSVLDNQPGEKSPFWDAVQWWDKQGRRVDGKNRCVYHREIPAVSLVLMTDKRTGLVVGDKSPARMELVWPGPTVTGAGGGREEGAPK